MPASTPSNRLRSLDVFRGFTMASMLLVNNPGSWGAIYGPFEHAAWHGWTFTDLIFPWFLWIVGVSIPFSFTKRLEANRRTLVWHIARRSLLLFLLGLVLNAIGPSFLHLATIRIPSVLGRIGICYLFAGVLFLFTQTRGRLLSIALLLVIYSLLMKFAPVPAYGHGIFEKEGNFARYVDSFVLTGHMWSRTQTWDPQGIISTLPAIANTLFGISAGQILQGRLTNESKSVWLFFVGNSLIFAGLVSNLWIPINKNLWTSSFCLFTAGVAFVVFAACYWLIDVCRYQKLIRPFEIFGMNALAIYMLSELFAKALGLIKVDTPQDQKVNLQSIIFHHIFALVTSERFASLLYALTMVLLFFGVAFLMHHRRWYLKL